MSARAFVFCFERVNIDAASIHRSISRRRHRIYRSTLRSRRLLPIKARRHARHQVGCARDASLRHLFIAQYPRGRWSRISQRVALSELAASSVPSHGQAQRSAERERNDESLCHVDEIKRRNGNAGKCEQSRARARPVSVLRESALHRARKISRDNSRVVVVRCCVSTLDRWHGQCRRIRTAPSG